MGNNNTPKSLQWGALWGGIVTPTPLMNHGVGPRAAVYMAITAPSCLPPITGQEELFAGVPYLPFVVAQFPPETMVRQKVCSNLPQKPYN